MEYGSEITGQKFNSDHLPNLEINIAQGAVICMCEDVLPIDHKNNFVPVWLI